MQIFKYGWVRNHILCLLKITYPILLGDEITFLCLFGLSALIVPCSLVRVFNTVMFLGWQDHSSAAGHSLWLCLSHISTQGVRITVVRFFFREAVVFLLAKEWCVLFHRTQSNPEEIISPLEDQSGCEYLSSEQTYTPPGSSWRWWKYRFPVLQHAFIPMQLLWKQSHKTPSCYCRLILFLLLSS